MYRRAIADPLACDWAVSVAEKAGVTGAKETSPSHRPRNNS